MIEYVPYQPEHFLKVSSNSVEMLMNDKLSADIHAYFPATTLLNDGVPIACWGVHEIWKGVGEVWAAIDKDILTIAPREFVIGTAGVFNEMLVHFHRLQCFVRADIEQANNFVKHYGFVEEGVLRQYSPDKEDYIMYARLKDGR